MKIYINIYEKWFFHEVKLWDSLGFLVEKDKEFHMI